MRLSLRRFHADIEIATPHAAARISQPPFPYAAGSPLFPDGRRLSAGIGSRASIAPSAVVIAPSAGDCGTRFLHGSHRYTEYAELYFSSTP